VQDKIHTHTNTNTPNKMTSYNNFGHFTTDPRGEFPLLLGNTDFEHWVPEGYQNILSGNEIMHKLEPIFYSDKYLHHYRGIEKERAECENEKKRKRQLEEEEHIDFDNFGFQHLYDEDIRNSQSLSEEEREQERQKERIIREMSDYYNIEKIQFINKEQEHQYYIYLSLLNHLHKVFKAPPSITWKECYIRKNISGIGLLDHRLFIVGARTVLQEINKRQLALGGV